MGGCWGATAWPRLRQRLAAEQQAHQAPLPLPHTRACPRSKRERERQKREKEEERKRAKEAARREKEEALREEIRKRKAEKEAVRGWARWGASWARWGRGREPVPAAAAGARLTPPPPVRTVPALSPQLRKTRLAAKMERAQRRQEEMSSRRATLASGALDGGGGESQDGGARTLDNQHSSFRNVGDGGWGAAGWLRVPCGVN